MAGRSPPTTLDGPAALAIRNGRVASFERDEFRRRDVLVAAGRVVAVDEDLDRYVGEETTVIDATDRWVVPGFIDAHTHVDLHQTVEGAQHRILAGGTTTLIAEVAEIGSTFGVEGVEAIRRATDESAVDVRLTIPPQPFVETFEPPSLSEESREALRALVGERWIVGVGETDWVHAVGGDGPSAELLELYDEAAAHGKPVAGHGAGCRGENLTAYAALVDNDHESISAGDVYDRLDRGIHVVGRYGSVRDDLDAIAAVWPDVSSRELSLSTDGAWPRDLLAAGHMDAVVRAAIDRGIDPLAAIRMATQTPARHYGLRDVGSIAPGNRANLLVLDDLASVSVADAFVDGTRVVRDGRPTSAAAPTTHSYPPRVYEPIDARVTPAVVAVSTDAVDGERVRAIEYEHGLVTSETAARPAREGDELVAAPERGLCKVTLLDRHPDRDREPFTGFITGLGIDRGAVATSLTWERAGVVGVGSNDSDLLAALEQVVADGGGWAVAQDRRVLETVRTPVGGVCSDRPVEETAAAYDALDDALGAIGLDHPNPTIPIQTLTSPGVPRLRLSFSGYADLRERSIRGLDPAVQ